MPNANTKPWGGGFEATLGFDNINILQNRYKKIHNGDRKKIYLDIGNQTIVRNIKTDPFTGKNIWENRASTKNVDFDSCEIALIYYTNSNLSYNRIVYINPKCEWLVDKYIL